MKNKNIAKIVVIGFLIGMIFSNFNVISNQNLDFFSNEPNLNPSDASDINFDETSLSIKYGTDIQQDRPYTFSGVFYDITDDFRVWSETAYLETKFVLDSDVWDNDSITSLDNTEIQSPVDSSISISEGSLYQNGTLNELDDDHAIFNSTNDYVEAIDFTTNYGNLISSGNLTEIDGDYSTYESEYESESPSSDDFIINNGTLFENETDLNSIDGDYMTFNSTEAGNYPATYSFENDSVGSNPSGFTITEPAGTSLSVIESFNNHRSVIEYYDNSDTQQCKLSRTLSSNQESGTLEYWFYMDVSNKDFYLDLFQDSTVVISFLVNNNNFYHYIAGSHLITSFTYGNWYHISIDFECGSSNYHGLSHDKWQLRINGVPYGSYDFRNYIDHVNKIDMYSGIVSYGYHVYLDAIGFSWDSNYDIGDNMDPIPAELDFTSTFQFDIENRDLGLFYSLKTDNSQLINISVYNFDTETFDLINSSISLDFTLDHFSLNSSHYNATNHIIINFLGINSTNDIYLYLEALGVQNSPILEIESTINCSLLDNFIYSFKTNISQSVELYLYNFSNSSYELIDNSSYLSFNLNYTSILSNYHDGTSLKVKFRAINITYNDFSFYLEVLKGFDISKLEFTLHTNLDHATYLLNFNCSAWYYTSIPILVNFSIYDFENSKWILMNSSSNDAGFFKSEYTNNTDYLYNFVDTDNDNQVLVRFNALNQTNDFNLYLDCLNVTVHRKLTLSFTKTFTLLGTWKYRFHIPEDDYSTDWIYFDVIPVQDNVEIVSESDLTTKWDFLETGYSTTDVYQSDFSSDVWNLHDVSNENLTFNINSLNDYLTVDGYNFSYIGNDINYQTYYDVSSKTIEPRGICWDGTNFYISDWYKDVEKYDSDFLWQSTYSVPSISFGMCYVEGFFYVVNLLEEVVRKYDSSFSLLNTYDISETNRPAGITWDGTYFYVVSVNDESVHIYDSTFNHIESYSISSTFQPMGIIWDGHYFYIVSQGNKYIYRYDPAPHLFYNVKIYDDISETYHPSGITWDGHYFYVVSVDNDRIYKYDIPHYYSTSKFYQSEDYIYMQTNTSEVLSMQTDLISSLNLQEGDKIEISFNTTSSNEIDFYMLNNGTIQKEYVISPETNNNFDDQTITLNIDGDCDINQLQFSGLLDDTNNLIVQNIKIYRYDENIEIQTFYVDPDGEKQVSLYFPRNYTYNVYERDILKKTGYITVSDILQTIIYEKISSIQVQITYYDTNNDYLNFNDYKTYLNYTYQGVEYIGYRSTTNLIHVDVGTSMVFSIYDLFNTIIKTTTKNAKNQIDITLDVYSLKIKNEASKNVSYTLSKGLIEKNGKVFPQEIAYFSIASGNYSLEYINDEDHLTKIEVFTLNDNKLITINTIYFKVYFSFFTYDYLGVEPSWIRFYINGEHENSEVNTLKQDVNNLLVLDFFNATLYDEDVNLRGYTEYNIYLEIYTILIMNNYNRSIEITINRAGSSKDFLQTIPSRDGLPYRFLPNIEYIISAYELNGTLLDSQTVNLNSNNKIVSFGFYQEEIPIIPEPFVQTNYMIIFIIFGIVIIVSMIGIIVTLKYKIRSEFEAKNDLSKNKIKNKKSGNAFDFRLFE